MTLDRARLRRSAGVASAALVLALAVTGCDGVAGIGGGDSADTPAAPASAASQAPTISSQFTRDGTFQSHIEARGMKDLDFVYTLYPTKATPRTNEWYPKGKKYFTFTFQAYDLSQGLRDPFETKRKVYLDTITVTSSTVTSDGGKTQHPFELDEVAQDVTFDPEPQTSKYGMLVTSPKSSFELRNNAIGGVSQDTIGINLEFEAVVWIEEKAGSEKYVKRTIAQTVPIAIFPSDEKTKATDIPVDAN